MCVSLSPLGVAPWHEALGYQLSPSEERNVDGKHRNLSGSGNDYGGIGIQGTPKRGRSAAQEDEHRLRGQRRNLAWPCRPRHCRPLRCRLV
jgi:hypothetical protein